MDGRLRAYTKLVRAACAVLAALFEFVTGESAPKVRDVLGNGKE